MSTETAPLSAHRIDMDEFIAQVEIIRVPPSWTLTDPLDLPPYFCEVVDTVDADTSFVLEYNTKILANGGETWARPIPKATTVAELRRLTDGAVEVSFDQFTRFVGDPDSRGHLYSASLADRDDEDHPDSIILDDRRPESLQQQLVDELRRVATFYADLADQAEAKLAEA